VWRNEYTTNGVSGGGGPRRRTKPRLLGPNQLRVSFTRSRVRAA
jgi:hypothetical protein